jgi:hypothetical protein
VLGTTSNPPLVPKQETVVKQLLVRTKGKRKDKGGKEQKEKKKYSRKGSKLALSIVYQPSSRLQVSALRRGTVSALFVDLIESMEPVSATEHSHANLDDAMDDLDLSSLNKQSGALPDDIEEAKHDGDLERLKLGEYM